MSPFRFEEVSPFRAECQPPEPSSHGSSHDEIGGSLGAVFTSEGDFPPRRGHHFVGLRLVAPVEGPRMIKMSGWPFFFKPARGQSGPDMMSTSTAALLSGGFRLAATRGEEAR